MLLKRLARERGVSESEIVRQVLEKELLGSRASKIPAEVSAWDEIERAIDDRKVLGKISEPYKWNRQEIYKEPESR